MNNPLTALVFAILATVGVFAGFALGQPTSAPALAPLVEQRYCGPPRRNSDGSIARSSAVYRAFRAAHPCPATGLSGGACAGWAVDHVVPLVDGGCDAVSNMQWLPNALKSCAGTLCKDRWEQRVYRAP